MEPFQVLYVLKAQTKKYKHIIYIVVVRLGSEKV